MKEGALNLAKSARAAKEIKNYINQKYPNINEKTLNAHIWTGEANNPKTYQRHKSIPKVLYKRDDGKYELYNREQHGDFTFNQEGVTQKRARLLLFKVTG